MTDASFPISRLSRIKELEDDVQMVRPASLRVYGMSPDASVIQIRILGPINAGGNGKPRKMMASAVLSADDLRTLRDLLDQEIVRLGADEKETA